MIKITADTAHKMVKTLEDEKRILKNNIQCYFKFEASINENLEDARPEFDFMNIHKRIEGIDHMAMKIKSARARFNMDTKLKSGLTVGEALVKMATINSDIHMYEQLASRQPKIRKGCTNGSDIEYVYANYNINDAKRIYEKMKKDVICIQKELNIINTTLEFEVDIDI